MNKSFNDLFISILLFVSLSCQYTPQTVLPSDISPFCIEYKDDNDNYFKIYHLNNNHDIKTDLVLAFPQEVKSGTVIAVYTSLNTIERKGRKFVNCAFETTATSSALREFVFTKTMEEYIGKGDYYVVLYHLTESFCASFQIFNEVDLIKLKNTSCYNRIRLYNSKKRYFHIVNSDYDYIVFNMGSDATKTPRLEIRAKALDGDIVMSTDKQSYSEYIKINREIKDYYMLIFQEEGTELSPDYSTSICIDLVTKRINAITHKETEKQFVYSIPYYFKLDLKPLELNEENGIVLDIDKTPTETYEAFYCKYTTDEEDEDNLIDQYPSDEPRNECGLMKDEVVDSSYHLYFKYTQTELNTLLVLVKVKDYHSTMPKLRIILPQLIEEIKDKCDTKVNIAVPKYFKINPNTLTRNVIIYSSKENTQSVIYGSLSSGNIVTKARYHNQLFVVSKKETESEQKEMVYIKLFGLDKQIDFEVMFTPIDIVYQSGESRPRISQLIKFHHCNEYMYFIGNYAKKSNDFLSIKNIYGIEIAFYSDFIEPNKKIIDFLPNKNNGKRIEETKQVSSSVDMMKISCTYLASFIINTTPPETPSPLIEKGNSFTTILHPNTELVIDLSAYDSFAYQATIENLNAKIDVLVNGKKVAQLNKFNKAYKHSLQKPKLELNDYDTNTPYVILFKSKIIGTEDAILSFQLGGEAEIISNPRLEIQSQSQYVIITSPRDEFYYKGTITLSATQQEQEHDNQDNDDQDLEICYSLSISEPKYLPYPKSNCQSFKSNFIFTFNVFFDKYTKQDYSLNSLLCLAYKFNKKPSTPITVKLEYDLKTIAESLFENNISFLQFKQPLVRTFKPIGSAENFNVMTFIPCQDKKLKYTISLDKEELETKEITKREMFYSKQYVSTLDIIFEMNQGTFMYSYASEDEIAQFKPTDDYSIEATVKNMTITVTFSPFVKEKEVTYWLFIVNSRNLTVVLDVCSLANEEFYEFVETSKEDKISFEVDMEKLGDYQINLVAITKDGLITYNIYKKTQILIENISFTWLWIVLGSIALISIGGMVVFLIYKKKMNDQESIHSLTKLI